MNSLGELQRGGGFDIGYFVPPGPFSARRGRRFGRRLLGRRLLGRRRGRRRRPPQEPRRWASSTTDL